MYNFTFHLELLSHILITGAGLHPSGGRVPGFWSEPVGAVVVSLGMAVVLLELWLSPGPPSPAQPLGVRMGFVAWFLILGDEFLVSPSPQVMGNWVWRGSTLCAALMIRIRRCDPFLLLARILIL